ncbi:MAG: outer membrane protein transport protein [Bradymonadaceae bacterium]|nr:outer membrane protein transport protein [Lujinxingiaceae bacterium]
MKRAKIIAGLASAAALMVAPQIALGAGFANTAQSGSATGMAGVATANPDEPNSNFYNPAAMPFRDKLNVYVGPTLIIPSVNHNPDRLGEADVQTVAAVFPPPNFNLAVPFGENYAAGIGVTLPWGLAISWPKGWYGRETFMSQQLQTVNVNPNFAYKFSGVDLSVAAGVQVMFSSLVQSRVVIPRDDTEIEITLGGSGFGLGGTFAVMYQPTKDITLGLNYRSRVRLNYEGVIHFDDPTDTPFEERFVDQGIKTHLTVPDTISIGAGWKVLDELFVGIDVNYMTWSVYDRIEVEYEKQSPQGGPGETQPSLVVDANWSDAMAVRLGMEYEAIENLKLRAGVAYDITPVPAETVGPSLPDNNRTVIGLGAGYTWNSMRADLGYQLVMVAERIIDNGSPVEGSYQMGAHVIGINVGYGF